MNDSMLQDREAVSRVAHNHEVPRSNRGPATNPPQPPDRADHQNGGRLPDPGAEDGGMSPAPGRDLLGEQSRLLLALIAAHDGVCPGVALERMIADRANRIGVPRLFSAGIARLGVDAVAELMPGRGERGDDLACVPEFERCAVNRFQDQRGRAPP